jgi:hypothetical protein
MFFERAGCGNLVAALLEKATPLTRLKRKVQFSDDWATRA